MEWVTQTFPDSWHNEEYQWYVWDLYFSIHPFFFHTTFQIYSSISPTNAVSNIFSFSLVFILGILWEFPAFLNLCSTSWTYSVAVCEWPSIILFYEQAVRPMGLMSRSAQLVYFSTACCDGKRQLERKKENRGVVGKMAWLNVLSTGAQSNAQNVYPLLCTLWNVSCVANLFKG